MLMCSRDNARFSAADKERLTLEFSMGMGDTGGWLGGWVNQWMGVGVGVGVQARKGISDTIQPKHGMVVWVEWSGLERAWEGLVEWQQMEECRLGGRLWVRVALHWAVEVETCLSAAAVAGWSACRGVWTPLQLAASASSLNRHRPPSLLSSLPPSLSLILPPSQAPSLPPSHPLLFPPSPFLSPPADSESSGAEEEGDVPEGQPRTPRRSTSVSRHVTVSRFMPTSRRIVQVSRGRAGWCGEWLVVMTVLLPLAMMS